MTPLDAALAAPTADEAAEIRQAVAEASAAGGGFVAVHLASTGRLFTCVVVADELAHWSLEPVADEADAQATAASHAADMVAGVQRLMAVLDGVPGAEVH